MVRRSSLPAIFILICAFGTWAESEIKAKRTIVGLAPLTTTSMGSRSRNWPGHGAGLGCGVFIEHLLGNIFSAGILANAIISLGGYSGLDLDLFGKARYQLEGQNGSNLYIKIPAGYSRTWFVDNRNCFNVGLFLGGHFHLSKRLGIYLEQGFSFKGTPKKGDGYGFLEFAAGIGLTIGIF